MLNTASAYATQQLTAVGEAYYLKSGDLAYRELHFESADGLDRTVIYQGDEQQPIAEKSVDYRPGMQTPAFSQRNWLYPETISVLWQEDKLRIQYAVENEKPKDEKVKVKTPLVIDAGFDHFIRDSWEKLLKKKAIDFYFPAVSRQSLIELRAQKHTCAKTIIIEQSCFSISPANWFIRALVDDIKLTYDSDSRQLRSFRGLANISDASGEGMEVEIRYIYPGEQGFPADIELPVITDK